jgi:hypothetical protein
MRVLLAIVVCASVSLITANPSVADSQCNKLLDHGIYDRFRQTSQASSAESIRKDVSDTYNRYQSDKKSGKLEGSYKVVSLDAEFSAEQIDALYKQLITSDRSDRQASSLASTYSDVISSRGLDAWQSCMALYRGNVDADIDYREEPSGSTGVTIGVRYAPNPAGGGALKQFFTGVTMDPPSSFTCTGPLWDKLQAAGKGGNVPLDNKVELMACTRKVSTQLVAVGGRNVFAEGAVLTIGTTAGNVKTSFAEIAPPKPPFPRQVGEIVASMLTQGPFQRVHGSEWVLADGQNVKGSAYSAATGMETVPDLRGVFLRGKNNGRAADGNAELSLGAYQADGFKTHVHSGVIGISGVKAGNVYDASPPQDRMNSFQPASTSTSVPDGAEETRPKNVTVNFFIKVN